MRISASLPRTARDRSTLLLSRSDGLQDGPSRAGVTGNGPSSPAAHPLNLPHVVSVPSRTPHPGECARVSERPPDCRSGAPWLGPPLRQSPRAGQAGIRRGGAAGCRFAFAPVGAGPLVHDDSAFGATYRKGPGSTPSAGGWPIVPSTGGSIGARVHEAGLVLGQAHTSMSVLCTPCRLEIFPRETAPAVSFLPQATQARPTPTAQGRPWAEGRGVSAHCSVVVVTRPPSHGCRSYGARQSATGAAGSG